MNVSQRTGELLAECEKLLREADSEVEYARRMFTTVGRVKVERRRNAINAACNALHRASRA